MHLVHPYGDTCWLSVPARSPLLRGAHPTTTGEDLSKEKKETDLVRTLEILTRSSKPKALETEDLISEGF